MYQRRNQQVSWYKENGNTIYLWDVSEAVLRRKFIAIKAYNEEKYGSEKNPQISHLKHLEKEELSTRKELIHIRAKINEIQNRKIGKIYETKSWFSLKTNRIGNPFKEKKRTEINKNINERGHITLKITEIWKISNYCDNYMPTDGIT